MTLQQGEIVGPVEVLVDGNLVLPDQNGQFRAPPGSQVKVTAFVHLGICAEITTDQVGLRDAEDECTTGYGDNTRIVVTGEIAQGTEIANITIDTGADGDPPAGGPGAESVTVHFNV